MFREPEQLVYRCDRCGAFFAYEEKHADEGHRHDPQARRVLVVREGAGFHGPNPVDFCGSCMDAFQVFRKGKRAELPQKPEPA